MNVVYPFPVPRVQKFFFLCCLCKFVLDKRVVQSYNWTVRLKGEFQHYYCDLTQLLNCLCDGCKMHLDFFSFSLLQSSSPCSLHTQDMPNNSTVLHRPMFAA